MSLDTQTKKNFYAIYSAQYDVFYKIISSVAVKYIKETEKRTELERKTNAFKQLIACPQQSESTISAYSNSLTTIKKCLSDTETRLKIYKSKLDGHAIGLLQLFNTRLTTCWILLNQIKSIKIKTHDITQDQIADIVKKSIENLGEKLTKEKFDQQVETIQRKHPHTCKYYEKRPCNLYQPEKNDLCY